jgi:ribosomal protein S27AE
MLICGHCGATVNDLQGLAVHLRCEEKPLPLVEVENTSTNTARDEICPQCGAPTYYCANADKMACIECAWVAPGKLSPIA